MPRLPLVLLALLVASSLAGCAASRATAPPASLPTGSPGRLSLPGPWDDSQGSLTPGVHRVASEDGVAWAFVPSDLSSPRPLLVFFHGEGGEAREAIDLLRPYADEQGMVLLAPQPVGETWDLRGDGRGSDAVALQHTLAGLGAMVPLDLAHVGVAGFAGGASYALSLGLENGDLFGSVLAFSPGFVTPRQPRGTPRVFIAHGTSDEVLDIDACSRALVPRLRAMGYGVTYREFDGRHAVPPEVASAAARWFAGG